MLRLLLPRLLLVVTMIPALCAATALLAATHGRAPDGPTAAVGAVSFAALTLAPSHQNAAMRGLVLAAAVAIGGAVMHLMG